MFSECSSLKALNLSNFIININTNMTEMFCSCNSLEDLNFSFFINDNEKNMRRMFYGCPNELINKIKSKNNIQSSHLFSF